MGQLWLHLEQRWDAGDDVYVHDGQPVIQTRDYEIADLKGKGSDTIAKTFVKANHYSRSYVAARRRFGLYRKGGLLEGVAVFSVPAQDRVVSPYFPEAPELPDGGKSTAELGRLVLLDAPGFNAETWFVGECFRRLKREGFAGVVSFSDPVKRLRLDGSEVMPGHWGRIYKGLGAHYAGRATPRILRLFPDGTTPHERSLQKIRSLERCWPSQVARLARYAREMRVEIPTFDPNWPPARRREWVRAAVAGTTRPMKHPGNLRYVWGLTPGYRAALPPNPHEYPQPPEGRPPARFGRRAVLLRAA